MRHSRRAGMTLIEVLTSVVIITIIAAITVTVFAGFRERKVLDAATEVVFSAFSKAYLDTVSSFGDMKYGVYIERDRLTVFDGDVYSTSSPRNSVYLIDNNIEIADLVLTGGGNSVIFSRVYGTTTQSGSFVVRSKKATTTKNTISIYSTGVISVQ